MRAVLLLLLLRPASPGCPGPCACAPRSADCSGRALPAVPAGLPRDAEALLLAGNRLTDLYGQLPDLPRLQLLDLSRNQVKQLGRGLIFHHLGELRTLNLSYNDFRTVFNGVFRGIQKLRLLAMTHVQIRFIEEHAFDGLRELRRLHLSHNQLNAVFPEWFRDLGRLEELRLESNHISHVNGGAFSGLGGLRRLSLSGNRIRGVSERAFEGLEGLATLDLEDNQLARVPSASLKAAKSLKVLKLGGNAFAQLQTGDFVHLSLEEVFVENVPELVLVDRGAFWDLPYLKALHLHHNARLRYLDAHAFIKVPNLRILSLHANNLSAVSAEAVKGFAKPVQVSLYENPLLCDCNVKWLHEAATGGDSGRVRILKPERMLCDRPPGFHRVPLRTLNRTLLPDHCPPVLAGPANLTVDKKIGDKHVFQCRAHGIPVPSVHWILPDGSVLNQTSSDVHFRLSSPGSLGIRHLKPGDSGTYACQAENPLGAALGLTHLTVESIDIHLFPLGVASTFVTVVWNGTARNAFPEYEIVYRREEDGARREYQSVTVSQFFRSYTINGLAPRSRYTFCIGVKSREDQQYVQLSCARARTRDESFVLQGIRRTSNVAVAAVLGIVTTMGAAVCALLVAARKYRQRHYDTPEKSLVGHMAQIPMESLHSPLVSQAGL